MIIRYLLKAIILIPAVLMISSCAFFFYPPTGEIDTVNIKVNFAVEGTLPSGTGYIGLFNEMNELIQMKRADAAGTYSFSNVELQHPNMSFRKTKVAFFIDANGNSKYDSTSIEESQTFAVTSVLDMQLYTEEATKEEVVNVNAMIFKVSGYINFHPDMGSDIDRKYLYWKGSKDSTYKIIKSNIGGDFEFYEGTRNDGSVMELYAFYDVDGDGMMNQLVDRVTFIGLYGTYGEINIPTINILKVYGTIDLSEITASGLYNLNAEASDTGNHAIIRIENRKFWRTTYTLPETDGGFNIFLAPNYPNDIILFHVSADITNYETQFQDHLTHPVRLAGPYTFTSDIEAYGAGGTGDPMTIHQGTVAITNNRAENTGNLRFVLRSCRTTYLVLDQFLNDENSSGIAPGTTKDYFFYFRDVDLLTAPVPPVDGGVMDINFYIYADENGNLIDDENPIITGAPDQQEKTITGPFNINWDLN